MGKRNKECDSPGKGDNKISRKEAIKKAGYAAFSATTMMLLLNNPAKVHAASTDNNNQGADPGNFDDDGFEW
ncbi:MAG: hypothetical protein ACLFQA_05655 [Bacteroidales bacterium]